MHYNRLKPFLVAGGEIVGIENSASTISCRINQYDDMFVWDASETVVEVFEMKCGEVSLTIECVKM